VLRPGGLLAVRDGDYGTMIHWPRTAGIDRWLELHHLVAGRNGADPDEVKRQVVAVALAHHLVSAYTSLVAVDVTPTAPPGSPAQKSALPVNLPEGLVYDALAGGLPQTATFATAQIIAGASLLMLALFAYARLKWRGRRADRLPDAWQRLLAATRAARGTC
jgi:Ca-activated chloride channel family protein